MGKKNFIILVIIVVIITAGFVYFISKKQEVGPASPPCWWIYKTTNDYFDYIAGIANNITGEMRIMGWPLNIGETRLIQGYILNGRGCITSAPNDWVIFNIKKTDYVEFKPPHPTLEDIIDRDPFREFYICQENIGQAVEDFNEIIQSGQLTQKCKKLK